VHWTGHESRLARTFGKRFGDDAYAFEELVAEIGSAFVCATTGIALDNLQHADYVGSWLKVLKADKRAIFTASSQAKKAAEFLTAQEEADEVAIAA
jgi:antirestriction protein ArdC